jgi:leader peptidase (prepilin peptidase)/N-methyltransferase
MDLVQVAGSAFQPLYYVLTAFVFAWGACIGSFLNVCIHRIPRELSVVRPRSACPTCGQFIAWSDNIPLLSYLLLRGNCRHCGSPISPRYWVVELLTAVLFLLVWLKMPILGANPALGLAPIAPQHWPLLLVYWTVVAGAVLGAFVDFEHFILPDRVTLGGIALGLGLSPLFPVLHGETHWLKALMWSSVGALVGWGLLWGVAIVGRLIFKKEAMGFGDVKLLGAIGALFGSKAVFFTILVSSFAGSLVGIALVLAGNRTMQSRIPFGPYILLAALVWLFWGPALWTFYIGLLLPPPL